MADDSLDIVEDFDFHPCNVPKGTKKYTLEDLTPGQREELNQIKLLRIRENHDYLATHLEVKAIIALLLQLVMKKRPNRNVHEFLAEYFLNASEDIKGEVQNYLDKRAITVSKDSTMRICDENLNSSTSSSASEIVSGMETPELKFSDDQLQRDMDEPATVCSEIMEDVMEEVLYKIERIETIRTFVGGEEIEDELQKIESAYSLCSIGFLADEPIVEDGGGSVAGSLINVLEDA